MRANRNLLAALGLWGPVGLAIAGGLSDAPSPENYVRRSSASATLLGHYVYIDGGEISQMLDGIKPENQGRLTNQVNSTLSIDMSKSWTAADVAIRTIDRPWWSKANQELWTDHEAGVFYVFGGKWIWGYNMTDNKLWKFTPDSQGGGTWSVEAPANPDLLRVLHPGEFGAVVNTADKGFIIGGIASGWTEYNRRGSNVLGGMVAYDFKSKVWQNGTDAFSPFSTLAGAQAQYLPTYGPNGLVMVFGGVSHPLAPAADWTTAPPHDFSNLTFFDPVTKKQYWQVATGEPPTYPRTAFCATSFQNRDGGYEILVFGGHNDRDRLYYEDAYILSLPGFVWVRVSDTPYGKRTTASCIAVGNRQMLSVAGNDGSWTTPDPAPQGLQLFDMTTLEWKLSFDADAAPYERNAGISKWYTNGSFEAVQWSSDEVRKLFPLKAAATTGSGSSNNTDSTIPTSRNSTPVGAIAGGVVGGVVALALIGFVVWFVVRRRNRQAQRDAVAALPDRPPSPSHYNDGGYYASDPSKPASELAGPKDFVAATEMQTTRNHAELGASPTYVSVSAGGLQAQWPPQQQQQQQYMPVAAFEMDATPATPARY